MLDEADSLDGDRVDVMDDAAGDDGVKEVPELEPLTGPAVLLPLSDEEPLKVVYIEGVVLEPAEVECPLPMLLLEDSEAGEALAEFDGDFEAAECLVVLVREGLPLVLLDMREVHVLTTLALDEVVSPLYDMDVVTETLSEEDSSVDDGEATEEVFNIFELDDERLPVTAPAVEELDSTEPLDELIVATELLPLEDEYVGSELEADIVKNVERELGVGTGVSEPVAELIEAVSAPTMVPLCVVEIELSVDGQPPELELEEEDVASALTSDEDWVIVTVI